MARLDKLQRLVAVVGLAMAAVLLVRFALDLTGELSPIVAVPFWALVFVSLGTGAAYQLARARVSDQGKAGRALLVFAIPISYLASSLDCTGLALDGCTPFCTFIKLVWVPLLAVAGVIYFLRSNGAILLMIALMLFVPLVPHCICYNPGNGWWIERLGRSPVCYAWGFTAGLISVSALRSGLSVWPAVVVCYAIIMGATVFFVAHHYFHFPW